MTKRTWYSDEKFKQEKVKMNLVLENRVPIEAEILKQLSQVGKGDVSRFLRMLLSLGYQTFAKQQGIALGNPVDVRTLAFNYEQSAISGSHAVSNVPSEQSQSVESSVIETAPPPTNNPPAHVDTANMPKFLQRQSDYGVEKTPKDDLAAGLVNM